MHRIRSEGIANAIAHLVRTVVMWSTVVIWRSFNATMPEMKVSCPPLTT